MSDVKTVTVAEHQGTTVVVNNKRDGVKKYATFFGMLILAAIIQGVQQLFPKMGPVLHLVLEGLQVLGIGVGGVALTSPFDKRGVVLESNGTVTVNQNSLPTPPSAPSGPGGVGLSLHMLLFCFGFSLLFLTGCGVSAGTAIPQSCPTTLSQPVPLLPVATASRVQPVSNIRTVGLQNPGAFPGENFSSVEGRSCQTRMTTDGWVTICNQPNDGDNFDLRNQYSAAVPRPAELARGNTVIVQRAPVVERQVTVAPPNVTAEAFPVRKGVANVATPLPPVTVAPSPPVATRDPAEARMELKARFPGLLGS